MKRMRRSAAAAAMTRDCGGGAEGEQDRSGLGDGARVLTRWSPSPTGSSAARPAGLLLAGGSLLSPALLPPGPEGALFEPLFPSPWFPFEPLFPSPWFPFEPLFPSPWFPFEPLFPSPWFPFEPGSSPAISSGARRPITPTRSSPPVPSNAVASATGLPPLNPPPPKPPMPPLKPRFPRRMPPGKPPLLRDACRNGTCRPVFSSSGTGAITKGASATASAGAGSALWLGGQALQRSPRRRWRKTTQGDLRRGNPWFQLGRRRVRHRRRERPSFGLAPCGVLPDDRVAQPNHGQDHQGSDRAPPPHAAFSHGRTRSAGRRYRRSRPLPPQPGCQMHFVHTARKNTRSLISTPAIVFPRR